MVLVLLLGMVKAMALPLPKASPPRNNHAKWFCCAFFEHFKSFEAFL